MALFAIIESLQILIVVMLILSFIPIPPTEFSKDLFPNNKTALLPNRKMFFLHLWVGACLVIYGAGLWFLRDKFKQGQSDKFLIRLITVDGCWLLAQIFLVFKMVLYPQLSWVKPVFYVIVAGAVCSRIFWIEIDAFLMKANEILPRLTSQPLWRWVLELSILLFMFSALWIFDQERLWVLMDLDGSRTYAQAALNVLSPLIKGVNYHAILSSLIILTIFYYGIFYLFLRRLFGSILLAGCGVLLAVKWQYFHLGVSPDIWQFPLKTILPLFFDIFFWLCLLSLGAQGQNLRMMGITCGILGLYLSYHFSTGVWLWVAWGAYLILTEERLQWYFLPGIICLGFWIIFCGFHGTFELIHQYWANMVLMLQGVGSIPFYDCLKGRNFFVFSVQFLIPVIYLVTMVTIKQKEMKMLMVPMAVYGLGLFTAHVWQPSVSNYDSVSGPLVIILCFWADSAASYLRPALRTMVMSLLLIVYAGALLTNSLFGIYPNAWNMSGVNWEQLKTLDQQRMLGHSS